MKDKLNTRNSGIELLRILAAMGVIALHYNNPLGGNAFELAGTNVNLMILKMVESFFICAVNVFILISGFYSSNSTIIKGRKLLLLLFQVSFVNELFFCIDVLLGKKSPSVASAVFSLLPRNWFMVLYVVLCILAPFINVGLSQLTAKGKGRFICVLVLLFSVYPTIVDYLGYFTNNAGLSSISRAGSEEGYTIVNFVMMYCIGAYLHEINWKPSKNATALLLCINTFVIFGLSFLPKQVEWFAWEYCSLFVVIQAVLLFEMFYSAKPFHNRVINSLAGGAFMVYLVHGYLLKHAGINRVANDARMFLHLPLTCIIIFVIGWAAHMLYELAVNRFMEKIVARIPKLDISIGEYLQ